MAETAIVTDDINVIVSLHSELRTMDSKRMFLALQPWTRDYGLVTGGACPPTLDYLIYQEDNET